MEVLMLVFELLACYFPAVAGARGRGSRKLWIGTILVGLFMGTVSMMLGYQLLGSFDPTYLSHPKGESFASQMTALLLAMIVRISICFCLGSFLAALLFRKHQKGLPSLLGLGSEIKKPLI